MKFISFSFKASFSHSIYVTEVFIVFKAILTFFFTLTNPFLCLWAPSGVSDWEKLHLQHKNIRQLLGYPLTVLLSVETLIDFVSDV